VRRTFQTLVPLIALSAPLFVLADGKPALDNAQILEHLESMRRTERGMMNVAPAEGEYLAGLVRELNARQVLEIGTSNGYSGIWLAMALRETGGKLITLEVDSQRHALAQSNFQATGLADVIDSRLADALIEIQTLPGPFDLVFIDALKPDYIRYFKAVLPKVRSGGVIAAHNVDSHPQSMQDFLNAVKTHPNLRTEFVHKGPSGLSISYKK
jgi:predicted O-methyltransferase YrrM